MVRGCFATLLLAILCAASIGHGIASLPKIDMVDTRIGSAGHGFGIGSINPGAQVPFGAMRLGPDSSWGSISFRWQHFGGYYYHDTDIDAFSHTHLVGAGVGDWGNVGVMVTRSISSTIIQDGNYRSKFTHENEVARPGYYSVPLLTPNATAEVTVSGPMAGIHQYTFHDTAPNSDAFVLVDVCHTISKDACANASVTTSFDASSRVANISGRVLTHGSLTGRSQYNGGVWVYFFASVPSTESVAVWQDKKLVPGSAGSSTSGSLGAYAKVSTSSVPSSGDIVATVRIGISFISEANAQLNLEAEQAGNPSFDAIKASTQAQWEARLNRVQIQADAATDPTDVVKFYGGLYRAQLAPTIYTESNNQYLGFDNKVHEWGPLGNYHSDMSLWDIHRSQTPFLTLVAPEVSRDTVRSMITMTEQGGKLPRWPLANVYTGCMTGSHGIVVVADAVVKGVKGINATAAFDACYASSTSQDKGNYDSLGYVPLEQFEQAPSLTLAYAFDDWATSQLAGVVGKTAEQAMLLNRSMNFKNVWDADQMFFCPKYANGTMFCPSIPELPYPLSTYYTEGDAWQYQWWVPGHPEDLVGLFPSTKEYVSRLNYFFNESLTWPLGTFMPNPYYWAGNEPDIFAPWQFNFAGGDFAHLTQYWTRRMLEVRYNDSPDGLPGNDDFGTMSAWECWAYLGLYPVSGSTRFSIGAPAFPQVQVVLPPSAMDALDVGDTFLESGSDVLVTITAHGASPTAVYVVNATANGQVLATPFVNWDQLVNDGKGGELEFWMSEQPHPWSS